MSGASHTPGPWAYRPQEHDDWGVVCTTVATDDGWHPVVAQARYVGEPSQDDLNRHRENGTDPAEANARLIAAAPELLEACETNRMALIAIADSALEAGFDGLADIIDGELTKVNAAIAKARGDA